MKIPGQFSVTINNEASLRSFDLCNLRRITETWQVKQRAHLKCSCATIPKFNQVIENFQKLRVDIRLQWRVSFGKSLKQTGKLCSSPPGPPPPRAHKRKTIDRDLQRARRSPHGRVFCGVAAARAGWPRLPTAQR